MLPTDPLRGPAMQDERASGPNEITRAPRSIHRLSKESCRTTHTFSLDGRGPPDDWEFQPVDVQAISPGFCKSSRQRTQKKSVAPGGMK